MTMKASQPEKGHEPPAINRVPELVGWIGTKSHFLFGPRQTGKTFLIHRLFSGIQWYDLLDTSVYLALSRNPGLLEEQRAPENNKVVVIDEVQRLPELLNAAGRGGPGAPLPPFPRCALGPRIYSATKA
jgi:predicted AAA+ superfamily ATPase